MLLVRHASWLAVSSALCACRGSSGDREAPSPPSSSTAVTATADAATKGQADAGEPAHATRLSNLLYTTDAAVAVSSKVDNPKDFPEHLLDGKAETAWNGKTGDLRGWIAVRIPAAAHVAWIAITAGFDKGDLFTQNHRIKKVRISRNGEKLREVELDVERRGAQKIPLDVDGGELRIEVLETIPGTKKEWKELTVSELSVWGDPKGAKLPTARIPRVTIGSFEAPKPVSVAPSPVADTFGALCKDHEARWKPTFAALKDEYPGFIEPPYCEVGAPLVGKPQPPFLEVVTVSRAERNERTSSVGVRTKKGIFFTGLALRVEELRNPGCEGGCTQRTKRSEIVSSPKGPALVTVVDEHCWSNPWPGSSDGSDAIPGSSSYRERAEVCTVSEAGDLACTPYEVATLEAKYREYDDDFARVPWRQAKRQRTLPSGEVVFE
ncbi:MAG: hypothetical protein JST00_24920 [Deltaproteobacteria bacterium]|nr:hypothetical protein [Deltaproteobacteria bacterium]